MKKQQKKKKSEGKVVKERDSMDNKEQRVARKDVMMMEEEEAFPRSNSGGLAPIEMKRIRKEAFDEAVAEENRHVKKRTKKAPRKEEADDDFFDSLVAADALPKFVELLKFKNVTVGSKMWGMIVEIRPTQLVVSLPHGLWGRVLLENASDGIRPGNTTNDVGQTTTKVEQLHLNKYFELGQYIRCCVKQVHGVSDGTRKKKVIDLATNVQSVHAGLGSDAVRQGAALTACVTSVEDHGYTLDFGIQGTSGFLLKKNMPLRELLPGSIIEVVVTNIKRQGHALVTADPSTVSSTVTIEWDGLNIQSLVPGALVNAKVRNLLSDGLVVSFLTFFSGTVDPFHIGKDDVQKGFQKDQKIKARILYLDPNTKRIALSLLPHLIARKMPNLPAKGDVFESSIVKRVDPGLGVLFSLPSSDEVGDMMAGYAHISHLSDSRIDDIQSRFKPGQIVKSRVIDLRPMDAIASLSLKPSFVESSILDLSGIEPGLKVSGIVEEVHENLLVLQLAPTLKAIVPHLHMSDVVSKKSHKKFKVGDKVSGRILEIKNNRKVKVTLKKSFVDSKHPILSKLEQALAGLKVQGLISGINDKGIFVTFYSNVSGFIDIEHLGISSKQTPLECFSVGQIVKPRVLSVNVARNKLKLSLLSRKQAAVAAAQSSAMGSLEPGAMVSGVVVKVINSEEGEPACYVLHLAEEDSETPSENLIGRLDVSHLSDHPTACSALSEAIAVGSKLTDILVLERMEAIGQLRLTRKALLKAAVANGIMPHTINDLKVGMVVPGYVASVKPGAVFVRFLGQLTGRAALSQLSDSTMTDANVLYSFGMSVRACIIQIDETKQRFSISLRPSLCASSDASLVHTLFADAELAYQMTLEQDSTVWPEYITYGAHVAASIHEVKDYGLLCDIESHPDIVGLIHPDHIVKEQINEGDKLEPIVLDVSKKDGIVDLSDLKSVKDRIKSADTRKSFQKGDIVQTTVCLVKNDEAYCVVLMPEQSNPMLGYLATADFNNAKAPVEYSYGDLVSAKVIALPSQETGDRLLLLPVESTDCVSTQKKSKQGPAKQSQINYPKPGTKVDIIINAIHTLHCEATIVGLGLKANVHISQVAPAEKEFQQARGSSPLTNITPGSKHEAVVLSKGETKKHRLLDVAIVQSDGTHPALLEWDNLHQGETVYGYIQDIKGENIWITYSPKIKGRCFIPQLATSIEDCISMSARYQVGTPVCTKILFAEPSKRVLEVDIISPEDKAESKSPCLKPGSTVLGFVMKVSSVSSGIQVKLSWNTYGYIDMTEIHPGAVENALKGVQEGTFVLAKVIQLENSSSGKEPDKSKGKNILSLSLRQTATPPVCKSGKENMANGVIPQPTCTGATPNPELTLKDISTGQQVSGYVKSVSKVGVFVSISRSIDARIKLRQLQDTFVEDPAAAYPPGTYVSGRITSIDGDKVDMSLRSNIKKRITVDGFSEGQIVQGTVKRIEKFGVFITIKDSNVHGLAHISELCDSHVQDISKLYKVGQQVQARILHVDKEAGKISLGLKPSYFDVGDESDEDDGVMDIDAGEQESEDDLDEALIGTGGDNQVDDYGLGAEEDGDNEDDDEASMDLDDELVSSEEAGDEDEEDDESE